MAEMIEIVRVAVEYGPAGARIVGATHISGPDPRIGAPEPQGDHGAWLSVHDPEGREVFRRRLADPATASERWTAEAGMDRLALDQPRLMVLEAPWPGEGSSVRIRVRSGAGPTAESTAVDLPLRPTPAAVLEAGPARLEVLPGWGEDNPAALTLLFLPDGFVESELGAFAAVVARCAEVFGRTEPYASLRSHLRFARVDIASRDSGITGVKARDTAFRGHVQKGSLDRVILVDQARAFEALNTHARRSAVALVVANTAKYGGSGGVATVFSCDPVWAPEIALHELGHSAFGLADEYADAGQSATDEPVEPNVCAHGDRARLKWASAVPASTTLPTWLKGATGEPPAGLGAFEGGKYKSEGVFRPAFDCKMRTPGAPFCGVCEAEIRKVLARHAPPS